MMNPFGQKKAFSDRHLLLYPVVFWPWHLARFEDANTCPIVTRIWDTFASGPNYRKWLHYHRKGVIIRKNSDDDFWRRSQFSQIHGGDLLESPNRSIYSSYRAYLETRMLQSCCSTGEPALSRFCIHRSGRAYFQA